MNEHTLRNPTTTKMSATIDQPNLQQSDQIIMDHPIPSQHSHHITLHNRWSMTSPRFGLLDGSLSCLLVVLSAVGKCFVTVL
mmetsp:Transcript_1738/g.3075  ORF Transcript_1738/g.3075 Transcript_1738/m.3075 type:complete len:82 (-) Transcript_1738:2113-2358(-)